MVITTAQLHSTKSEFRFCAGSNPARGMSKIWDGENLWQWSGLEIKTKRLSSFNHSSKTIYHHQDILILFILRNWFLTVLIVALIVKTKYFCDDIIFNLVNCTKTYDREQPAKSLMSCTQ